MQSSIVVASTQGNFNEPHDICIGGSQNRVYVADRRNKRIQVFDQDGSLVAVCLAACIAPLFVAGSALAQDRNPVGQLGTLGSLMLPRDGTPKHEGSWDRRGGNGDARTVKPGETLTLLDVKGAGVIRRFWATIAPRSEMTRPQ